MEPKGGHVLLLSLMVISWTIDVICEAQSEETRLVFGAEGSNVTLQLNRNDVEDVSWVYDGDHVRVKTRPGKPIDIRDPDHKGNMWATEDASLVIMNVSLEDQKVYTASLQLKETQESYVIRYDLKVYKILSAEDIQLEGNNTNAEPCRVLLTCVVKEPNVTVTWRNGSGLIFTGNVLNIEDAHSNLNITCTAKNPISNITKAVEPSQFCGGKTDGNTRNTGLRVVVSILIAVTVVGIVSYFVYPKVRQRLKCILPNGGEESPPHAGPPNGGEESPAHAGPPNGGEESPAHAGPPNGGEEMGTVPRPVERTRSTIKSAAAEGKSDPTASHESAEVTTQQTALTSDASEGFPPAAQEESSVCSFQARFLQDDHIEVELQLDS